MPVSIYSFEFTLFSPLTVENAFFCLYLITSSFVQSTDNEIEVVTDPDDPKFDLEKLLAKWEKEL